MRRAAAIALLAGATSAGLAGPALGDRGDEPEPSRILARGTEFDLTLSSAKVAPGRAIVQFLNDGEDPHDLRIQRQGATAEEGVGEVLPGDYASLDTRLRKASTYVLWCSLGDHRSLGMEATLRTRKRRR